MSLMSMSIVNVKNGVFRNVSERFNPIPLEILRIRAITMETIKGNGKGVPNW